MFWIFISRLSICFYLLLFILSPYGYSVDKDIFTYTNQEGEITLIIKEPFNGAIVNKNYDALTKTNKIDIYVRGKAVGANSLTINGKSTNISNDGRFEKLITVTNIKQEIVIIAKNNLNEVKKTITVFIDKDSFKRYHYSIDDALYILYDLHINRENYDSIFQQPEFSFLKKMHEKYGITASIYLYYQDGHDVPSSWNLSKMTDKYKAEFCNNAHWLRFSFHALSNSPVYPYVSTDYMTAKRHFELVKKEVDRFAGTNTWTTFTRIHYWSGSIEAISAWRDSGIEGFFGSDDNNDYKDTYNSYYMNIGTDKWNYTHENDYYRDMDLGVYFFQTDLWLEKTADISAALNRLVTQPKEAEIIDIFHHDARTPSGGLRSIAGKKKAEEAFKWLTKHGYTPVFHDGFLKEIN